MPYKQRTKTKLPSNENRTVLSLPFHRVSLLLPQTKTRNTMKQLIFSLLALCFLTSAHAQTVGFTKELEPAILQCTYKCTMKLDTLGTDTKTDRTILRIGKNISQFYSYTAFYSASGKTSANSIRTPLSVPTRYGKRPTGNGFGDKR